MIHPLVIIGITFATVGMALTKPRNNESKPDGDHSDGNPDEHDLPASDRTEGGDVAGKSGEVTDPNLEGDDE